MLNTYDTITNYNLIQTFYADPDIVNNSGEVAITSVNLFFKSKPNALKNVSGKVDPGVMVRICEVNNDSPDLAKVYFGYTSYKGYNEINTFSDASTATTFGFSKPLKLVTGRFYGIVVIFEDPSFELWQNKSGDRLVGTNSTSSGSNLVKDGKLFLKNNSEVYKALSDTDLKFNISCAKYSSNTVSEVFVNKDYEFLTVSNITNRFIGGELVYQNVANSTGNVAFVAGTSYITGNGTTFTSTLAKNDRIVLFSNSTYTQVVTVLNVVNNSYIDTSSLIVQSNSQTKFMLPPSGTVHYYSKVDGKLFLSGSNANTTLKFLSNSNIIQAEDSRSTATIASVDVYTVDRVRLKGDIYTPASGSVNNAITFAYYNGSSYLFDTANKQKIQANQPNMFNIAQYNGQILSRSLEVDNATLATNTNLLITRKSVVVNTDININLSSTDLYQSPTINSNDLDLFTVQNRVSNTYTTVDANSITIDTEVAGMGSAISKHISSKVTFANNRFAEDVRVFMTAYRPANTELKVYTRVHNSADSDAFDDRSWTPLEYKANGSKFSSRNDEGDFIEYELGLPSYGESATILGGTFTTSLNSNIITGQGIAPNSFLNFKDVVKVYNPLIPEDYIIAVVSAVSSTTITLGAVIANNNIVGSGFKVDRLKYYNTAFNNKTKDNVSRYYNSSLVEFDKFDSMQIKIVMLSDTTYKVPKVDQIQVIGVSA